MCMARIALVIGFTALVACGQPEPKAVADNAPVAVAVPVSAHPDPLSQLANQDPAVAANKRLVFDFWRTVINGGHADAIDDMLLEGYTQHSPALPTGRAAIKQVFSSIPRLEQVPALVSPPLVASVGEGNLVVMALAEQLPDPAGGKYTSTHFNLFRVEGGRLAEHWHSVQTPPGPKSLLPEEGGAQPIKGASGADQGALLVAADPALAANKRRVFDFWRELMDAGRLDMADQYLDANFIHHNPNAAPGKAGFVAELAKRGQKPLQANIADPVVALVAEGNTVVLVTQHEFPHPHQQGRTYTTAWFDMFRLQGDRIVEHWDATMKNGAQAPSYGGEAQQGEKK